MTLGSKILPFRKRDREIAIDHATDFVDDYPRFRKESTNHVPVVAPVVGFSIPPHAGK